MIINRWTNPSRNNEANLNTLTDLVDAYLMFAASAIAANTVLRSAAGAAAPLFTRQMFSALGIGGGGSLVGGVGALLAIIPFAFYKYGRKIREKSRFAPTDGKDNNQQDQTDEAEKGAAGAGDGAAGAESSDTQSIEGAREGDSGGDSEGEKEIREFRS